MLLITQHSTGRTQPFMTTGTVPPSCFDWEKVCTQTELDNVHRIRMVDIELNNYNLFNVEAVK